MMFRRTSATPESTWNEYSATWTAAKRVRGGAVGPYLERTREHKLCEEFARLHPNARNFLVEKLECEDPLLAAYAFKCLIRICDLERDDLPPHTFQRHEIVEVQQGGCIIETQTLGQFFEAYFDEDVESDDGDNGN